MNKDMGPELVTLKFGGLKGHRWSRPDHLVIVGYNESQGHFFAFDRKRVRSAVDRLPLPLLGRQDPAVRARTLFRAFDPTNYMSAQFEYVGTLFVDELAHSKRHFVLATIDDVDREMQSDLSYRPLDPSKDLTGQVSEHHVRVVKNIIEARLAA